MSPPLTIFENLANGKGGALLSYDRTSGKYEATSAPLKGAKISGYLFRFKPGVTSSSQAVIFAADDKFFLDEGSGPVEILPIPALVRSAFGIHSVEFHTVQGARTLSVVSPPHRYLLNDGMFPEDVEPIVHMLGTVSDPMNPRRAQLMHFLQFHAWPNSSRET